MEKEKKYRSYLFSIPLDGKENFRWEWNLDGVYKTICPYRETSNN